MIDTILLGRSCDVASNYVKWIVDCFACEGDWWFRARILDWFARRSCCFEVEGGWMIILMDLIIFSMEIDVVEKGRV